MKYLQFTEDELREKGALFTAKEIEGQPDIWNQTAKKFYEENTEINTFLKTALAQSNQIILTGAGTSAFIGLSLQGAFFRNTGIISNAISTTDLVSHPHNYLNAHQTPLIISFARSGNSPESCAALALADSFTKKCFHLIITCNKDGALSNYTSKNPIHVINLPMDTNDKSLAMTGSYTSMLLTGLLIAYREQKEFCTQQLMRVANASSQIITTQTTELKDIAEKHFQRAVFLGSGALFGTATEAALKLQELTDGQIICKSDTYLGFRHGPKSVIDDTTLVVYFFINDEHIRQYETDLVHAMKKGNAVMFQIGVAENKVENIDTDTQINFPGEYMIAEDFLPLCSIIPAQILGFYKSLQIGLMPDAPSVSGAISRVVQGVKIYSVEV